MIQTQTDWEKLETMSDAEIDTTDIPPLTENFFNRARVLNPSSPGLVELDADVVSWFKKASPNYQEQINRVLRKHIRLQER